jgi:hypothetical protein
MQTDYNVSNKLVFVMGGGKFGTNALKYMQDRGAKVVVADVNPECLASSEVDFVSDKLDTFGSLKSGESALVVGEAVELLLAALNQHDLDLVVTAIQGNAVAKTVELHVTNKDMKFEPYRDAVSEVLKNLPESLVSFADEESGVIVCSYMPSDLRCRENCVPPRGVCAVTGRPKLATMDRLLVFSVFGLTDMSGVLVSKELKGGGLGAIEGKDLAALLKKFDKISGPCTLAVGTACECHGILNLAVIK